ncbi:MAG: phenylacetate--CoA ligase [Clostridiaceae bacterium BRH_c20a]|nr:MAG: phenylacetate--CoA ligase [Clostridiaceae bacterium BRH_c20a]
MASKYEKKIRNARTPLFITRYLTGPADSLPLARLKDFQAAALKEVINSAYRNTDFYHQKMTEANIQPQAIKSLADLAKLPFTTKDELRGNPWVLLACDKKDIGLIHVSTGTTGGEQIYIMHSWRDLYLHDLAPEYPGVFDVDPGDLCFNALPYEMSSAGLAFHKVFLDGCLATVIPAGKGGAYSTPEKSIKLLRDLKPNVIMTTPSYSMTLYEKALEEDFDLRSLPIKKIWLTGEGCSPAFRNRVEKIWGAAANFYYGSLEAGFLGIECNEHNGYHIPLTHTIVEIIDPKTGNVLEPGQIGEIVATCLLRIDTPLIRYRTQDLGYIDTEPCKCGVKFPRLFMRGRVVDEVIVNGVNFSPFYLEEFLMRLPEIGNWYQFIIKEGDNDKLKIRTELVEGVQPTSELADKLASKMEYALGIPCEMEFVPKIPRPQAKTIRVLKE